MSSEQYAPDEPASFDAIVERQPYEPAKESADPFVGKEGLSEAADEVSRARETREVTRRWIRDPDDFSKVAEKDVTITAETAADALKAARTQEMEWENAEVERATAAAVDDFRGEQPAQPEQPEFQQTQPQAPEIQPETGFEPADELDRLLNSVPDPNTRQHIRLGLIQHYAAQEAQIAQAREAAVAHANAAAAALEQRTLETFLIAEQAALAPFPELANVRREDMQVVLNHIRQSNPQRFEEIDRHVSRVKGLAANQLQTMQVLHQQQQVASQAQQAQQQQAFRQFAEYHDARIGDVAPEVTNEVVSMAQEHGISKQELAQLWQSNPVIRHSAFQAMMRDAALYRLAQKSIPKAVARPVAHVQRPGVTSDDARDHSEYASLERQYRGQSLTPKQAAELVIAKRGRR
jgi:hypothetical protein